ncbi:hypothetical protein PAHAL_6G035600 [Panicum hallii]|uniref:Uncharacterized protein n=1 Tax=Panicum hallii TaxID=206008 RepID=A0A2T8IF46_9POAL|nr:hypothetical protein PAHAL_6G035600 [Panicum hallii]
MSNDAVSQVGPTCHCDMSVKSHVKPTPSDPRSGGPHRAARQLAAAAAGDYGRVLLPRRRTARSGSGYGGTPTSARGKRRRSRPPRSPRERRRRASQPPPVKPSCATALGMGIGERKNGANRTPMEAERVMRG